MTDYTVTRRSLDQLERIAKDILNDCQKLENGAIDILAALREPWIKTIHGKKRLRLNLVADHLLPDKFAQMWATKDRVSITARLSLWNRAQDFDPAALKELRHEYSHGVLHSEERTSGSVALDRRLQGNQVHSFINPQERAEEQADALEACLAMPHDKIQPNSDVRNIVADWNVTLSSMAPRENSHLRAKEGSCLYTVPNRNSASSEQHS